MIPAALSFCLHRPPQFESLHGAANEALKPRAVPFGHAVRMRLGVDHTQRAGRLAVFVLERTPA